MKKLNSSIIRHIFIGFTLLAVTCSAYSMPILSGSSSAATGIENLNINGTAYDVTFYNLSYNDLFSSSSSPTFLGNITLAQQAANSIKTVLDDLGVTGILNLVPINSSPIYIDIPYAFSANSYDTWSAQYSSAGWSVSSTPGILKSLNPVSTAIATFSLASTVNNNSIPEPATLSLLGFGLAGLLGINYRKNKLKVRHCYEQ